MKEFFKVGDKVRRLTPHPTGLIQPGHVGVVTKISPAGIFINVDNIVCEGDETPFSFSHFELCEEDNRGALLLLLKDLAMRDCFGEVMSKHLDPILEKLSPEMLAFFKRERVLCKLSDEDKVILGIVA